MERGEIGERRDWRMERFENGERRDWRMKRLERLENGDIGEWSTVREGVR